MSTRTVRSLPWHVSNLSSVSTLMGAISFIAMFVLAAQPGSCQQITSLPGLASHGPSDSTVPARRGVGTGGSSYADWNIYRFDPNANSAAQAMMAAFYDQNFSSTASGNDQRVFTRPGNSSECYLDVNDNTATWPRATQTEGMGYALMFAAQMNDQTTFLKLWTFIQDNMLNTNRRYIDAPQSEFVYQCSINSDGTVTGQSGFAQDGDEWITTALLFAGIRWNNSGYLQAAYQAIESLINPDVPYYNACDFNASYTNLQGQTVTLPAIGWGVTGAPNMEICEVGFNRDNETDASYHLPAFYNAWTYYANRLGLSSSDVNEINGLIYRDRFCFLPTVGGVYFENNGGIVSNLGNNATGLSALGQQFNGDVFDASDNLYEFDSWRVPSNIALDFAWWGDTTLPGQSNPWQFTYGNTLASFLDAALAGTNHTYYQIYDLNGTAGSPVYSRSDGQVGMNAVGSIIAAGSNAAPLALDLLNQTPEGQYYNDILYLRGLIEATGTMRFSWPATITGVTPTSGPVGTMVTITGTNFTGVSKVRFHNASAATYSANSGGTQIIVTVPSGAAKGTITVTTPSGSVTSSQTFTVTVPPTISAISPASGPVGTAVTVTGTNFTGVSRIRFHNANAVTYTVTSSTQISVTVPSGAGTGTITVTTPGGESKSQTAFTVN